jgi:hypothetical protein
MEAFAEYYQAANPDIIEDTDSTFVLAYAIIMLNVDQHNPRVKKRMTADDFIKNQRCVQRPGRVYDLHIVWIELGATKVSFPFPEQIVRDLGNFFRWKVAFSALFPKFFASSSIHKMYVDMGRNGRKSWLRQLQSKRLYGGESTRIVRCLPSTVRDGPETWLVFRANPAL